MPVNATKRASILRFDDLPLQHLQATRYAALNKKRNLTFRKKYLSLALVS
jgi:hypothetical protein